jgi:hypothetical protein
MSGICGIIHDEASRPAARGLLLSINMAMVHRWPHEEWYHVELGAGIPIRSLFKANPVNGESGKIDTCPGFTVNRFVVLDHITQRLKR